MAEVDSFALMEMYTRDIGNKIRLMGTEYFHQQMALLMKELGRIISSMEEDKRNGKMVHSIKEVINKERRKDMVYSNGQMAPNLKVSGSMVNKKAQVYYIMWNQAQK